MSRDQATMRINRPVSTIVFGFDSAWMNKQPGAICAIAFDEDRNVSFEKPTSARFEDARDFIEPRRVDYKMSLIAIDQPTIVKNQRGMRPVERCAARLISYVGGGAQPAYRGGNKAGMFGDGAPIWKFIENLEVEQQPQEVKKATEGHFLIGVFPTLALTALSPNFGKRKGIPKYNPKTKNFAWKTGRKYCGLSA